MNINTNTNHFNIKKMTINQAEFLQNFKKLDVASRNLLRPILFDPNQDQIKVLNKFRKLYQYKDLVKIYNALTKIEDYERKVIPDYFPTTAQVYDDFQRLKCIELKKQVKIVELLALQNKNKLNDFFKKIDGLNKLIITKKYKESDSEIEKIYQKFGYSHFLLRKILLIKELNNDKNNLNFVQKFISEYNSTGRNLIISSLQQCYQIDIDYLGLKKSIINRHEKSLFCKHISEIPFTYLQSHNLEEINEKLLSNIQSSLIDGLFFLKYNNNFLNLKDIDTIDNVISIKNPSIDLNDLAKFYINNYETDSEDIFYKHSSAWYEIDDIYKYRILNDNFYSESMGKIEIKEQLHIINEWIADLSLDELSISQSLTKHNYLDLKILEESGSITRSSIFNHIMMKNEGNVIISLSSLYNLMGRTQDLSRTVDQKYLRMAAEKTDCLESQIIFYLLIGKKSRNEKDNHRLKKYIQKITIERFNSNLVDFVKYLSTKSKAVAEYTYELCTEDFIATMSQIIPTTLKITETRADLHTWMGDFTGDRQYNDRARTLLIDHQINRIRNEIDDNRIYVDSYRFNEWICDDILREFNSCLSSLSQNSLLDYYDSPQLLLLIEKAYFEFCNNKIFGISSYLGRRIRHGTFKGHLFSNVIIPLEEQYEVLLSDPSFLTQWKIWKNEYEKKIDNIIRHNLHIKSTKNKDGLIQTDLNSPSKTDVAYACAKNIISEFISKNGTSTLSTVIVEYCWRLIVIDLRNINDFLKNQKNEILNKTKIEQLKINQNQRIKELTTSFTLELHRTINDKFISIYEWFKRPHSVAPKASLSLLFKAVIEEVRDTFPLFKDIDGDNQFDFELFGGAYHVIYDALYVIIYNAAKHGKPTSHLEKFYTIDPSNYKIIVSVSSDIKDSDNEDYINSRLQVDQEMDIDNAQLSEDRSGIKKLYHLMKYDNNFVIEKIECSNRKVNIIFSYKVLHNV